MQTTTTQPVMWDLTRGVPGADEDPIGVRLAQAEYPGDLAAMIEEDWDAFAGARTVVVDAERLGLGDADVAALTRLATVGVRVVITAARRPATFPPLLVLYEPTFARAAAAAIYALDPGRRVLLVSPDPYDSPDLRRLVAHALAWRAAWQEPEAGDFTSRPME